VGQALDAIEVQHRIYKKLCLSTRLRADEIALHRAAGRSRLSAHHKRI
jgi:hypothetical protein